MLFNVRVALACLAFVTSLYPTCLPAAEPQLIATSVDHYAALDSGRVLLLRGNDFQVLDLATGEETTWNFGWDPFADGWTHFADNETAPYWSVTGSPDGKTVAVVANAGMDNPDPADEYPYYAPVVVLADSDGGNARAVALAEQRDGGPQLIFTRDSSRLLVNMPMYCDPTPQSYLALIQADYQLAGQSPFNTIETASGLRGMVHGLEDAEYYDPCPISDFLQADLLFNEPTMRFIDLGSGRTLTTIARGYDSYGGYMQWAGADLMLLNRDGSQQVIDVYGDMTEYPDQRWQCFLPIAGGHALFSRDGGRSIEYGVPDFRRRSVDGAVKVPELSQFAEPVAEDGWPQFVNRWQLLPDRRTVLVYTVQDGSLWTWKLP